MNKVCGHCGQEAPHNAAVCGHCGEAFPKEESSAAKIFCGKCGAQMDAEERFCAQCGATSNVTAPPAKPANAASSFKLPNNKTLGIIGAAVALLILIIVAISAIAGGDRNMDRVLERYLEATFDGNFRRLNRYSAIGFDSFFDQIRDEAGLSQREFRDILDDEFGVRSVSELIEVFAQDEREWLERRLGGNIRQSFTITESTTIRGRQMRERIEALELSLERMGIEPGNVIRTDRINEWIDLRVEITVTGRDDSITHTERITMVRIGRNWRVLDDVDFAMFARIFW